MCIDYYIIKMSMCTGFYRIVSFIKVNASHTLEECIFFTDLFLNNTRMLAHLKSNTFCYKKTNSDS